MPNQPEVIDPDAIMDTTVPDKTKEEEEEGAAAAAAAAGGDNEDEPFMEEVDLGNGETLTFTGKTAEEVRDKVFAHIREQHKKPVVQTSAQEKTETPAQPAKPKQLSEDEQFAIDREFKEGSPIKALNDFMVKSTGLTLAEIAENAKQGGQAAISQQKFNREVSGVAEFRKNNPEYVGNDANKMAMDLYLKGNNLEATAQNLEKAYKELRAGGVLKNDPPPNTENTDDKGKGEGEGEGKPNPPAKKVASSMLWGRRGTTSRREPPKKGPTEADITKNFNEGGSDAVLAALQAAYETPTA